MDVDQKVKGYLEELKRQHPSSSKIGDSLLEPIAKCEQQICNGRYNIRQATTGVDTAVNDTRADPAKISKEQHSEFMQRLLEEKRELRKKQRLRLREEKSREKQEEDQKQRKLEEERERKVEMKKKQLEQRLSAIDQFRKRRASQISASNQAVNALKQANPLHQRLMVDFLHTEANALEEQKKRLAEIRALHKPLSKEEFRQHELKLERLKQKVERQRPMTKDRRSNSVSNIYKSSWYQKAKEENLASEAQDKDTEEARRIKQAREKLKEYGSYVKSNFKPEVDPKKAEQLREQISNVVHKPAELKGDEAKKIGLEYLKYSKEHIIHNKTEVDAPPATQLKPINYLEEMKKNRQKKEQTHNPIESVIKSVDNPDRSLLIGQVERMEEEARRREKFSRVNHSIVDEKLDELYVNTIKAKLALIK